MRKQNEGYALPMVLVVMVVICIIAISVMSFSLRGLQKQADSIENMQAKYEAQGELEKLTAKILGGSIYLGEDEKLRIKYKGKGGFSQKENAPDAEDTPTDESEATEETKSTEETESTDETKSTEESRPVGENAPIEGDSPAVEQSPTEEDELLTIWVANSDKTVWIKAILRLSGESASVKPASYDESTGLYTFLIENIQSVKYVDYQIITGEVGQ